MDYANETAIAVISFNAERSEAGRERGKGGKGKRLQVSHATFTFTGGSIVGCACRRLIVINYGTWRGSRFHSHPVYRAFARCVKPAASKYARFSEG